jgi:hypothetical protein
VELLVYFCARIKKFTPSIQRNTGLLKFYVRLTEAIRKKITLLHEDLQFDYGAELNALTG